MKIKIGARIKELRKKQNVTQEQLAEALGVTNQAVSRWESETGYPDIEYIVPIASFFKVTANYLLDDGSGINISKAEAGEIKDTNGNAVHCSFCGKHHDQVKMVIAGPNKIYICNECILVCINVMFEAHDFSKSA